MRSKRLGRREFLKTVGISGVGFLAGCGASPNSLNNSATVKKPLSPPQRRARKASPKKRPSFSCFQTDEQKLSSAVDEFSNASLIFTDRGMVKIPMFETTTSSFEGLKEYSFSRDAVLFKFFDSDSEYTSRTIMRFPVARDYLVLNPALYHSLSTFFPSDSLFSLLSLFQPRGVVRIQRSYNIFAVLYAYFFPEERNRYRIGDGLFYLDELDFPSVRWSFSLKRIGSSVDFSEHLPLFNRLIKRHKRGANFLTVIKKGGFAFAHIRRQFITVSERGAHISYSHRLQPPNRAAVNSMLAEVVFSNNRCNPPLVFHTYEDHFFIAPMLGERIVSRISDGRILTLHVMWRGYDKRTNAKPVVLLDRS